MRICLLTHTLNPQTGAGIFASHIVEGVKRMNADYEFAVLCSEDSLKPNLLHLLKNFYSIRKAVRTAEVVHAIDAYPYGVIAGLANLGIGRPIIITAVGSGSLIKLKGSGLRSILLRWAYRQAVSITAISQYVASEVKKTLPNLPIKVINPGVDYNFYSRQEKEGTEHNYVITLGEFKKRKGYSEMLPLMAEVMTLRPDLKYVIVANTERNQPYRDEIYKLIEKLGIKEKVIIRSSLSQENLREAYTNALLYLSLPRNSEGDVEGFGMAIMEAAASGTPSVVGRGSGADDAVSDGQSGFLVDGQNKEEVIGKILSLVDNKELRDRLSEGARAWAARNSWESKIKQYIDLYEKV